MYVTYNMLLKKIYLHTYDVRISPLMKTGFLIFDV